MRFLKSFVEETANTLTQLGVGKCPLCGTEHAMYCQRKPAILRVGGFPKDKDDPLRDPEANVLFMLMLVCETCGYTALVNSEKHRDGETKALAVGITQEEEDALDT